MYRFIKPDTNISDWTIDTNDDEINAFREVMLANEILDDVSLGLFWYDVNKQELFGVYSVSNEDVQFYDSKLFKHRVRTCRKLHYQIWDKGKHKGKDSRFKYDYTSVPRGRVFEIENQGFVVCVGSWINKYPEAKQLILEEFDLPKDNTMFKIDIHWEVGHGMSDKFV